MRWRLSPGLTAALLRFSVTLPVFALIFVTADTYGPHWAGYPVHLGLGMATPPVAAWCWLPVFPRWKMTWLSCAIWGMLIGLLQPPRDIWQFYGNALSLVILLIIWFWRSGRRKRATHALGNKARAIQAKLTRTMRERLIPIPRPA